jgi:hypothetical protein
VAAAQWSRLDQKYLRQWASVLGVGESLEQLLQEAQKLQTP